MDTNPHYIPIQSTPPLWTAEPLNQNTIMPVPVKLDSAAFNAVDASTVTVGAAGALANATSIPVDALANAIPSGAVLNFGTKKFAVLSAPAAKGATALAVAAIPTALADRDTATYAGTGKKSLPSGTLIGRTYAERDASAAWGKAVVASDDEIYLTVRDASDLSKDATNEILTPKTKIKENYLPGWANFTTAEKAAVRAIYVCIGGKD